MEAIPDDELAGSIATVELLAATFQNDSPDVAALFDVLGVILRAESGRPLILQ